MAITSFILIFNNYLILFNLLIRCAWARSSWQRWAVQKLNIPSSQWRISSKMSLMAVAWVHWYPSIVHSCSSFQVKQSVRPEILTMVFACKANLVKASHLYRCRTPFHLCYFDSAGQFASPNNVQSLCTNQWEETAQPWASLQMGFFQQQVHSCRDYIAGVLNTCLLWSAFSFKSINNLNRIL